MRRLLEWSNGKPPVRWMNTSGDRKGAAYATFSLVDEYPVGVPGDRSDPCPAEAPARQKIGRIEDQSSDPANVTNGVYCHDIHE
ncbi:protein of unknown function [Nitrospira japonica]|uniref:Uncharacterized protein n=1 Tax=Nitrospira japonica TaxID=1325564 RepID=A0A1W1I2H9_9BACT|nr:protein of unknown function [Nitrospira japonica]